MTKIAAFASALLMSTAALAQSDSLSSWVEIEDDSVLIPELNVTVDDLDDMDLYDLSGQEIGEVDDVLGPDAATATAVSIEIEQGFMKGDKEVILDVADLAIVDGRLVTDLTAAELDAMAPHED